LNLVRQLGRKKDAGHGLDVISGSAGAIPVLLEFYQRYRQQWLLDQATKEGERLLRAAQKTQRGWSWKTLEMRTRGNLTGLSHGAAGIGWSLLELFDATREARFRAAAEQAFRYEREWFNPQEENWADLRIFDNATVRENESPVCSVAWCHGAPGIALSRLRAYEILGEDIYRREAEAGLRTTAKSIDGAKQPGYGNFSLCHGHAGNAEVILYATQILGPKLKQLVEATATYGIEVYQNQRLPWPCGVLGAGETPTLMLGLAGIGHFYLRLVDPIRVPSLLVISGGRGAPSSHATRRARRATNKGQLRK